jgi:deoxyribodipyrimidine photo-lyase
MAARGRGPGKRRIIWWLRRDLRLADNRSLCQALVDGASVIPVFILDPALLHGGTLAPARRQFLFDSLADLDEQLHARGSRLILRQGDPARELVRLVGETLAEAVYFHADITPYARQRDMRATHALAAIGMRLASFPDAYLAAPDQVRKDNGQPYIVYTPYRRRFDQVVEIPPRDSTRGRLDTPEEIPSLQLADWVPARNGRFARGGEGEAQRLLRAFLRRPNGLSRYAEARNDMALDSTSHLSPHLHFGTISVRELARSARAMQGKSGAHNVNLWIGELVWREFFGQVLWHFPHAARGSFRPAYVDLQWENDEAKFAAWCDGCTGYPIVDAAMRQLNETGWMHNRARMIVASFLTKDLLIDWRWGEHYFMQHLVDGDTASNNGGWQWAAGTGTDAQPFFRIFNPVEQGRRFDPQGAYVRHWIPELARVPARYVHAPWTMPRGITPPIDYPDPVVDHAAQRRRALMLYRRGR